ncbi:hypothetical protein NBRC116589_28420 [Ruegeria sp. HU-ET01832]
MTDPPIRQALPKRQPDTDEAPYHGIAARPLKSGRSPKRTEMCSPKGIAAIDILLSGLTHH